MQRKQGRSGAMTKILSSHSGLKTSLSFGADVRARYEKSAVRSGGKSSATRCPRRMIRHPGSLGNDGINVVLAATKLNSVSCWSGVQLIE